MPITKVGLDAIHHGKKLFPLLCQLKNFGKGRIIYSTLEQQFPEPSFYRILLAQPEMDDEMRYGRIVTERVYRGKRFTTPHNMSGKQTEFPDYRLVPKHQEDEFCRWAEIVDYDPQSHAPLRSRHMELPPLLKLVMERNRAARAEKAAETGSEIRKEDKEDLLLPAYKIYDKDVRLTDTVESNLSMAEEIGEEFATQKKYDIMSLLPQDGFIHGTLRSTTGIRAGPAPMEECAYGYEKMMELEAEARKKVEEELSSGQN